MSIQEIIANAEKVLPGVTAPEGEQCPRWQAVIEVAEFVETHPEELWLFAVRWGSHEDEDLRTAIATCLLEHLLQYHFKLIFPRIKQLVKENHYFAETFCWCCTFGQTEIPENLKQFKQLKEEISNRFVRE